jgi:hypothetical protein
MCAHKVSQPLFDEAETVSQIARNGAVNTIKEEITSQARRGCFGLLSSQYPVDVAYRLKRELDKHGYNAIVEVDPQFPKFARLAISWGHFSAPEQQ